MKLRNKKTGEIVSLQGELTYDDKVRLLTHYNSLAELNEEWEDYKELGYWYYDTTANRPDFIENCNVTKEDKKLDEQIGNYFETKEEAEKAVEKLRAWKRLKDKGFRFDGFEVFGEGQLVIDGVLPALEGADNAERLKIIDDLDLLFGGEE